MGLYSGGRCHQGQKCTVSVFLRRLLKNHLCQRIGAGDHPSAILSFRIAPPDKNQQVVDGGGLIIRPVVIRMDIPAENGIGDDNLFVFDGVYDPSLVCRLTCQ